MLHLYPPKEEYPNLSRSKKGRKRQKDNTWLWWIVILTLLWLWDQTEKSNSLSEQQFISTQTTSLVVSQTTDPCREDILNGVPPEHSRCSNDSLEPFFDPEVNYEDTETGCPNGCDYQKEGCDIKGNISLSTGEKIYHLPGQEYYSSTSIDPSYSERWFCTEAEAQANGWRRSKK